VIGSGPPTSGGIQPQIELTLTSRQPLTGHRLQQLQLDVIVR
jgi:hypothetical protein